MSTAIFLQKNTLKTKGQINLSTRVGRTGQVIDVEIDNNESRCKTVLCIVDKNNPDSMLGAALWISKVNFDKKVEVYSYHPLDFSKPEGCWDEVVNFGCFIPTARLNDFKGRILTKIFTYRNVFMDLKPSDILEVIRPCDDWYDAEQAAVDNSIAFNVNAHMIENGNPSEMYCLRSLVRDVALSTNFAHKGSSSIEVQSKISNLREKLEQCFSKAKVTDAVRELTVTADLNSYRSVVAKLRQIAKINVKEEIFTLASKSFFKPDKYYVFKTYSCPSNMSRDLMKMVLPTNKSCITYEDIGVFKLVRIVTDDKLKSISFAENMKPLSMWEEGSTVVLVIQNS